MLKNNCKKVLSILLICIICCLTSACSIFSTNTYVTEDGDLLSKSLSEAKEFMEKVRIIYITIDDLNFQYAEEGLITEENYNNVADVLLRFKAQHAKIKKPLLAWYDLEDNSDKILEKQLLKKDIDILMNIAIELVEELAKCTNISKEEIATIRISVQTIMTLYNGGAE